MRTARAVNWSMESSRQDIAVLLNVDRTLSTGALVA